MLSYYCNNTQTCVKLTALTLASANSNLLPIKRTSMRQSNLSYKCSVAQGEKLKMIYSKLPKIIDVSQLAARDAISHYIKYTLSRRLPFFSTLSTIDHQITHSTSDDRHTC
jgi:hypothetical protein